MRKHLNRPEILSLPPPSFTHSLPHRHLQAQLNIPLMFEDIFAPVMFTLVLQQYSRRYALKNFTNTNTDTDVGLINFTNNNTRLKTYTANTDLSCPSRLALCHYLLT